MNGLASHLPPGTLAGRTSRGLGAVAFAALAALLLLPRLGDAALWQDEAQTALVARTVVDGGLPRGTDGRNVFSQELGREVAEGGLWRWHTWLSFYAVAASFALLGESTFAARLPFALFGVASVALTWWAGLRLWRSRWAAASAAGMLALCVPFLLLTRQCRYYAAATFFSLWGLHAYAGLAAGRRRATLALAAAAFLLFHTHYVYCAGLLAALWVHAGLFERQRLRPLAWVTAAVILANLPWIVWFSAVRPGGDAWWASVIDPGKAARYALDYARLLSESFFPPWLLLAPLLAVALDRRRGEAAWNVSPATRSGVALIALFCLVNVVLLSVLSPLRFYRYLAPLAPPLLLLAGLLVGSLLARFPAAGAALIALWLATGSLRDYADELRHDFSGPIEGIVGFLEAHAREGDTVAISYGDLPLKFYTNLRVVGGLTGEDLGEAREARWVIRRRRTNTHEDRRVRDELTAIVRRGGYRRHVIDAPDTLFENREDPRVHRYRSAGSEVPRVVIFERIR